MARSNWWGGPRDRIIRVQKRRSPGVQTVTATFDKLIKNSNKDMSEIEDRPRNRHRYTKFELERKLMHDATIKKITACAFSYVCKSET
jgi:phosphoribulokinase